MTNPPYGNAPGGQWPPPGTPTSQAPAWAPAAPRQSRAPVITSLVVAIVAVAVAIGAWFKPSSEIKPPADSTPKYSSEQIADAKKALCAAHDLVTRATEAAGSQTSDDSTVKFLFAVNGRVGAITSASYFLATLDQYPATDEELASAVRATALAYQETNLLHLANAPKEEIDVVYAKLDAADAKFVGACK